MSDEDVRRPFRSMRVDTNPCFGCTQQTGRHPGCHDHCDRRKVWLKEKESIDRNRKKYLEDISPHIPGWHK